MAFQRAAKAASKPISEALSSILGKLGKAIKEPAIPEIGARGTAEAPKLMEGAATPVVFRAKGVPFKGDPELYGAVREVTPKPTRTLEEAIQQHKEAIGSFIRRDPNLPKDIQHGLYEAARQTENARVQADALQRHIYEPLQANPVEQFTHLQDFLTTSDEYAQALRDRRDYVFGQPIEKWASTLKKLEETVKADPEIPEALARRMETLTKIFDDMEQRGWLLPDRFLDDNTHLRKVKAMAKGLATEMGMEPDEFLKTYVIQDGPVRRLDMIKMETDVIENYISKVAQMDEFGKLMADPTVNLTSQYKLYERLASSHVAYLPKPGWFGYARLAPEEQIVSGMANEWGLSDVLTPGAYAIPKQLAKAFNEFNVAAGRRVKLEANLIKLGRIAVKAMTVYNPSNTRLNQIGDSLQALFSAIPGEPMRALGVMRFLPTASKASYEIAWGKNPMMKLNGQTVDIRAWVDQEGLGSSTLFNEIQGYKMSEELARLYPKEMRQQEFALLDVLHKDRYAVELTPRIAAGLEAYERTGDIKEFGRVGREITMTYGAGGPKASRVPLTRFMGPFLQFRGLAIGRVIDLLRAKESRNRTLVGLMAVPVVTWMWNTHSAEYQEVEDSLTPFERTQSHVIMPGWDGSPMRDLNGEPVVIRFQWWVPEEVMKMAGLGNVAARVHRVVRGRDTPEEAAIETLSSAARSTAEAVAMMPNFFSDLTQTETYGGRKLEIPERVMRALPMTRPFIRGAESAVDYGPIEGAKTFGAEVLGIRRANIMRRGETLGDADLIIAKAKLNEARRAYRKALINEGVSEQRKAEARLEKAIADIERIGDVVEAESGE